MSNIYANNYDLSINGYKEVVNDRKAYEKPDIIIAHIELLDEERKGLMEELKEMLKVNKNAIAPGELNCSSQQQHAKA